MNFIKIDPRPGHPKFLKDEIRASFILQSKQKNIYSLRLCVGKYIFDKLGINEKDKISFYYEEKDKKQWLIKKSFTNIGYVSRLLSTNYYKIQITTWRLFCPSEEERGTRTIKYDFHDGGCRLYFE